MLVTTCPARMVCSSQANSPKVAAMVTEPASEDAGEESCEDDHP